MSAKRPRGHTLARSWGSSLSKRLNVALDLGICVIGETVRVPVTYAYKRTGMQRRRVAICQNYGGIRKAFVFCVIVKCRTSRVLFMWIMSYPGLREGATLWRICKRFTLDAISSNATAITRRPGVSYSVEWQRCEYSVVFSVVSLERADS